MGAVTIEQMANRVAGLMEERLHIRGKGLSEKLRRGGRALPRRVRSEAELLAASAVQAQNPRLLMQMDEARVAQAYDICVRHLGSIDAWGRRRALFMGVASSVAFSLFVVGALVLAVLAWRGFI